MKNSFKEAAGGLPEAEQDERSPAEKALMNWGIGYKKQADGSILVPGNLDISNKGLTSLPDLRKVKVGGYFRCDNNQLTSLEGAPHTVGGNFWCEHNQLTSLKYGPQSVNGTFYCFNNRLTSLAGAPRAVGGFFYCENNQLASLEHAPQCFENLHSDLGKFSSWQEVPEILRLSPETKARQEQERQEQKEAAIQVATVLSAPLIVNGPLRLKRLHSSAAFS